MGGACGLMGQETNVCRAFMGKPERNTPLKDLDVEGRIILKRISNE
jgi:hypothetical protein